MTPGVPSGRVLRKECLEVEYPILGSRCKALERQIRVIRSEQSDRRNQIIGSSCVDRDRAVLIGSSCTDPIEPY
ncbi:NAC domain-containing protein 78-like [Dorcoceras hygrometricum]|uniref:NAC domain-containing protein 78-like n=1 Tax=Dorcoceras hygrometricum TaxID=472368 RepID=A0A2Z6ZY92_9LAMI|nr:NAC domain-containing protein 78-like [Dorcoceras hygrometricum]